MSDSTTTLDLASNYLPNKFDESSLFAPSQPREESIVSSGSLTVAFLEDSDTSWALINIQELNITKKRVIAVAISLLMFAFGLFDILLFLFKEIYLIDPFISFIVFLSGLFLLITFYLSIKK